MATFRLNRAAFEQMKAPPKTRRVHFEGYVDVPATDSDEDATALVKGALSVECWLGEVGEICFTKVGEPIATEFGD